MNAKIVTSIIILLISLIPCYYGFTIEALHPNDVVFSEYPSDGSAFNEIHRYYGDCDVFGEVSSFCYNAGYGLVDKTDFISELSDIGFTMSQGQVDICNMMFNKATYDQFMGKDSEQLLQLEADITKACSVAITNIDERDFNEKYGDRKDK